MNIITKNIVLAKVLQATLENYVYVSGDSSKTPIITALTMQNNCVHILCVREGTISSTFPRRRKWVRETWELYGFTFILPPLIFIYIFFYFGWREREKRLQIHLRGTHRVVRGSAKFVGQQQAEKFPVVFLSRDFRDYNEWIFPNEMNKSFKVDRKNFSHARHKLWWCLLARYVPFILLLVCSFHALVVSSFFWWRNKNKWIKVRKGKGERIFFCAWSNFLWAWVSH